MLCTKNGMAPNAVAAELNIPSGSITAWRKGTQPRSSTVKRIADYFHVTTQYLLFGDDPSIKKDTTLSSDVSALSDLQREAWEALQKMDDDSLRAFITLAKRALGE